MKYILYIYIHIYKIAPYYPPFSTLTFTFLCFPLFLSQLWEQQKQLEEQRREKERLEALRKKDKHDHSAIASTEVKQRLQVYSSGGSKTPYFVSRIIPFACVDNFHRRRGEIREMSNDNIIKKNIKIYIYKVLKSIFFCILLRVKRVK